MSDKSKVLHALITTGICNYTAAVDLEDINSMLRPLSFEAVLWPSKSHFVLKDWSKQQDVLPPWKEESVEEAKAMLTRLAHGERIKVKGSHPLKDNLWVEEDENGNLRLSKRALVQFDEFIVGLNGCYKRCLLCKFLTDSDDCYHKYCKSLIEKTNNE